MWGIGPCMRRSLLLVLLLTLLTAARAEAAPLPVVYDFPAALAVGTAAPESSPRGANDFSCKPTSAHPRPVVLVHGTVENARINWSALSPLLKNAGYCVFALNYGGSAGVPFKATARLRDSAREIATYVDRVLAATGAREVDIVGHSQGGMLPRQYARALGGAAKIKRLVGLVPSNHGTDVGGLIRLTDAIPGSRATVGGFVPAFEDQFVGSPFLTQLNAGGDRTPGVENTVITTRYDQVVTPYTSAFLAGARNITVQDGCPIDGTEHLAIPYDRRALRFVLNALDPANARAVPCVPVLPLVGG